MKYLITILILMCTLQVSSQAIYNSDSTEVILVIDTVYNTSGIYNDIHKKIRINVNTLDITTIHKDGVTQFFESRGRIKVWTLRDDNDVYCNYEVWKVIDTRRPKRRMVIIYYLAYEYITFQYADGSEYRYMIAEPKRLLTE